MSDKPHHDSTETAWASFPSRGTEAAFTFFHAALSDFRLFHFIIDVVLKGDYIAFVAKAALEGDQSYKEVEPVDLAKTAPGPLIKVLRKNRQSLLEMFFVRLVDNFQNYLADLIRAVLHANPSMLRTRQQTLTLEELMGYERIEDLVHDIIERRVNSLTYEGFIELQTWCSERGLEIRVNETDRDAVVELIAVRNVITHNRGIVDERYLRTVPGSTFSLADVRELDTDDLAQAQILLSGVVTETDEHAALKFDLPISELRSRLKDVMGELNEGGEVNPEPSN